MGKKLEEISFALDQKGFVVVAVVVIFVVIVIVVVIRVVFAAIADPVTPGMMGMAIWGDLSLKRATK